MTFMSSEENHQIFIIKIWFFSGMDNIAFILKKTLYLFTCGQVLLVDNFYLWTIFTCGQFSHCGQFLLVVNFHLTRGQFLLVVNFHLTSGQFSHFGQNWNIGQTVSPVLLQFSVRHTETIYSISFILKMPPNDTGCL